MTTESESQRMWMFFCHPELVALIMPVLVSAVSCLEAYIVEAVVYQKRKYPYSVYILSTYGQFARCEMV